MSKILDIAVTDFEVADQIVSMLEDEGITDEEAVLDLVAALYTFIMQMENPEQVLDEVVEILSTTPGGEDE